LRRHGPAENGSDAICNGARRRHGCGPNNTVLGQFSEGSLQRHDVKRTCRVVAKTVLGAILGWLQVACLVVGVLETLR
jgi:hypothetical protein